MTVVDLLLAEHREVLMRLDADPGPDPSVTLLTPRYRTSRNVIALVAPRRDRSIAVVAKLPRDGASGPLRAEADALRMLESYLPAIRNVPRVVALHDELGRVALVETAVGGRVVGRADLVGDRNGWAERVAAWIEPLGDLPATVAASSVSDTLDDALHILDEHAAEDDLLRDSVARSRSMLANLSGLMTPIALEHGDFSPPNLLITPSGDLGVVDWELAGPSSIPLHDLIFFLTHIAWESVQGAPGKHLQSVRRAIVDPDGWARRVIDRQADQRRIGRERVPFLVLACWTRYAARTLQRVAWADPADTRPSTDRRDHIRNLRALRIWESIAYWLDRPVLSA